MSTALVAQWIYEHLWLTPLPPAIWYLQWTRVARTVIAVVRGEVRDQWLRAKGVPEATRRELAVDTVRRDIESPLLTVVERVEGSCGVVASSSARRR